VLAKLLNVPFTHSKTNQKSQLKKLNLKLKGTGMKATDNTHLLISNVNRKVWVTTNQLSNYTRLSFTSETLDNTGGNTTTSIFEMYLLPSELDDLVTKLQRHQAP
jgi:hypothetical protein